MMYKIRDYPYVTLRDRVLFPGLLCGVELPPGAAQDAVQAAWTSESKTLAIFTTLVDGEGGLDDLFPIGVLAAARKLSESTLEVEVLERVRLRDISRLPHPIAQVELLETPRQELSAEESENLDRELRSLASQIFASSGEMGRRAGDMVEQIAEEAPMSLVEILASTLAIPARDALEILAAETVGQAQRRLLKAQKALWAARPSQMVRPVTYPAVDEDEDFEESATRLRELIEELDLEPEILDRLAPELDRIERFDPVLFEHQETFSRLEGLLAFPWHIRGEGVPKLDQIEKALDLAVHGHERAKGLLLDLACVRSLRPDARLPLLIVTGPPGLGQGTLVRALANGLGRPLQKIALPSEGAAKLLTGQPRGLPGASEGAIYQSALSAGTSDPVLYLTSPGPLDEATVTVLAQLADPDSSRHFHDAYLALPLDVSQMLIVLQVRTPEMVPEALRERAVLLELEGYTPAQKREILLQHLWPEALREVGLASKSARIQPALAEWLILERTREAGVAELRHLTRHLASRLARRRAGGKLKASATLAMARDCLGEAKVDNRDGAALGVVGQAALVDSGAEILEVAAFRGASPVLSNLLQKAVELATSWGLVQRRGAQEGSWHFVVPDQALPQDQPALAFPLSLALRSASLGAPIARDLAVLGRLGLGGEILPVGHATERALAAWRAGYRTLLVSAGQVEPLARLLPREISATLRLIPVATLEDAARAALGPSRGQMNDHAAA